MLFFFNVPRRGVIFVMLYSFFIILSSRSIVAILCQVGYRLWQPDVQEHKIFPFPLAVSSITTSIFLRRTRATCCLQSFPVFLFNNVWRLLPKVWRVVVCGLWW